MKYDAITLDTNVFIKNGYNFESRLLEQLTQFRKGSVQLVLSEIVTRELKEHLIKNSREILSKFEDSLKDIKKYRLFSEEALEDIHTLIAKHDNANTTAENRLKKFIEDTGAQIIGAEHASVTALVEGYFNHLPPFEKTAKKKCEFPDAIALLALNDWAQKNNKKILAVSEDSGWHNYAKDSKRIDVEKDLSKALEVFQEDLVHAEQVVSGLLAALSQGKNPDLLDEMNAQIQNAMVSLDPCIEARSNLSYDPELESFQCENFDFVKNDENYEFTITQTGVNKIVAEIPLSMQVKASVIFWLYLYDSIDEDEVSMGAENIETEDTLHISALVTFEGNFQASPPEVKISKLVLLKSNPTIDFGEIQRFREEE